MLKKSAAYGRERGHIRRRGNSYQVLMYAGVDPLTGRELRLTESTTDEAKAKEILKRFRAQVDEQRHARTKSQLPSCHGGVAASARHRGDDP
jgi:integrase